MFDWILSVMQSAGYAGLFFLMLLENIFPPIPSELIIPLAGFLSAQGEMSPYLALFSATAGATIGAVFWYGLGRWIGRDRLMRWAGRHGRWIGLRPRDLVAASAWFERHGAKAVFLGRMVPGIRTFISVPAGLAEMPWPAFLGWTFAGSLVWSGVLVALGYLLDANYARVADWISPVSTWVSVGLVAAYLWNVLRK
ncbi:MAG TPA: alkaline phosphatase [Sulfitobacter sp.]|nr:alkaline phosphatase [Roseovarius sp.]HCQ59575.1 alkaline phosphatase [Sulfitobacter sp.]|tara:strand:- start:971 stop:1558 length:588 start_codon:yes stop_codon:yes gene_type:complete